MCKFKKETESVESILPSTDLTQLTLRAIYKYIFTS